LKVTQILPARAGKGMRVRMVVASEPHIPPFWVLTDCQIDHLAPVAAKDIPLDSPVLDSDVRMEMRPVSYGLGQAPETPADVVGRSTRRLIHAGETLRAGMLDPLILVRSGQPVEILLQGRGMRITAEATPLDAGMSGQKIRVRNQVTGKILTATVVGPRLVEIQF
ncbi:MAG: flagellar basal body P-ring formation chaperone FlgA, partial [Candidatus Acidiferrales bacterium]